MSDPTKDSAALEARVEEAKRAAMQAIVDGLNEACRELDLDFEAHLDSTESSALDALIVAVRTQALAEAEDAIGPFLCCAGCAEKALAALRALGAKP